jgi:hypothetical protein
MYTALCVLVQAEMGHSTCALDTDSNYTMRIDVCSLRPGEVMFVVGSAAEVRPVGASGSCNWSLSNFVADAQVLVTSHSIPF